MARAFRLAVAYRFPRDPGKRPPLPDWLREGRDVGTAYTALRVSYDYWTKLYWATPPWLTEAMVEEMKVVYLGARDDQHVDHIVPLKGRTVCGLHVPWNLQVLSGPENLRKSNSHWPDMWGEQCGLPIPMLEGQVPCSSDAEETGRAVRPPIQADLSCLWMRQPEASMEGGEGEDPQADLPL